MKPTWDQLMSEFNTGTDGAKTPLIADVDCTGAGKALCEKFNVRGYPTIKYGDPADLQDYDGGRDYESLKKFADEKLGPACGPDNLDLCDADAKVMIAKFLTTDIDELDLKIEEAEANIEKIKNQSAGRLAKHKKKLESVQAKIKAEMKDLEDKVAQSSKKTGLALMKSIAASKKSKDHEEL
mmetsp:Transcript_102061/g.274476  ORF Transcript_102061/g.274476 Transcript_102061/m.274476 type:complete len:182 (-) Transcript_102061:103-648(-)